MEPIVCIHIKDPAPEGYTRVFCGRGQGHLGNPHFMRNKSQEERNRVCDYFERELPKRAQEPGPFRDALVDLYRRVRAGEKLALVCFCKPQRCHTDSIKNFILSKI